MSLECVSVVVVRPGYGLILEVGHLNCSIATAWDMIVAGT
jgi:hypothetical protein